MKSNLTLGSSAKIAALTLVVAGLSFLSSRSLADQKGGELLTTIAASQAPTAVADAKPAAKGTMSCSKCADSQATVTQKTHAGAKAELATVQKHLCPTCDTRMASVGSGKSAKTTAVHSCKEAGASGASACAMK